MRWNSITTAHSLHQGEVEGATRWEWGAAEGKNGLAWYEKMSVKSDDVGVAHIPSVFSANCSIMKWRYKADTQPANPTRAPNGPPGTVNAPRRQYPPGRRNDKISYNASFRHLTTAHERYLPSVRAESKGLATLGRVKKDTCRESISKSTVMKLLYLHGHQPTAW